MRPATAPLRGVARFSFPAPTGISGLAISPDGTRIAYVSPRGIAIRSRDQLTEAMLDVTIGSRPLAAFFSPDGKWVGYADDMTLVKVPTAGGRVIALAEVGPGAAASWSDEGIVFADIRGLHRVSSEGGPTEKLPMSPLGDAEQPLYPELLPGGRSVLFTVIPTRAGVQLSQRSAGASGTRTELLTLDTGVRKTLVQGGGRARYLPSGHLVYVVAGSLYAVAFDARHLEVRGEPVQVVPNVANMEFAVSDEGTLIYLAGEGSNLRTLVWVDRQGHEETLDAPTRSYTYPRLSPDGTRVALDVAGPPDRDIFIWHLRRRTLERFTVDPTANPLVAWSPDGTLIAFGSDRFGPTNLFVQPADKSRDPQRLIESDRLQMPISFAPDGRLLFSEAVPKHARDIQALSLDGSRRVQSLVHSPAFDAAAEVSPDGRWLAYDSNESGQFEVYVRPYPETDRARWQVSAGGGRQPLWSRDGRELFYRDFSGAIMLVPVTLRPAFSSGPAAKIIEGSRYTGSGPFLSARTYDLSSDGRFLMLKPVESVSSRSIVVVLNWFEELRRLAPGGNASR